MKFKIKKGKHSSGWHFPRLVFSSNAKTKAYRVLFTPECLYNYINNDSKDINKLCGWSEGFHMNNSFRIGWRGINGFIEFFLFMHDGGEIRTHSLGTFPYSLIHTMSITVTKRTMCVNVNGNIMSMARNNLRKFPFGYKLYPYFGGDNTAPHDMEIEIIEI